MCSTSSLHWSPGSLYSRNLPAFLIDGDVIFDPRSAAADVAVGQRIFLKTCHDFVVMVIALSVFLILLMLVM